jgi:hypothetical protein
MQCGNNLKQFALAMHNFVDTHNVLPAHGIGGGHNDDGGVTNGNYRSRTVQVGILPYIEQNARYALFTDVNWSIFFWEGSAAGEMYHNPISAFLCPSDSNGTAPAGSETDDGHYFTMTNYTVSQGDFARRHQGLFAGTNSAGRVTGMNDMRTAFTYVDGWTHISDSKGFNDISDGLSNTIVVCEKVITSNDRKGSVVGSFVRSTNVVSQFAIGGDYSWIAGTVDGAMGLVAGKRYANESSYGVDRGGLPTGKPGYFLLRGPDNGPDGASGGNDNQWKFYNSYAYWTTYDVCFNTILPPNGPSISWDYDASGGFMPPSSYHTAGVNSAFGDGSVHYIPETVNAQRDDLRWDDSLNDGYSHAVQPDAANAALKTWRNRNIGLLPEGPSPYGVWGSLGAINDGEAVSLP